MTACSPACTPPDAKAPEAKADPAKPHDVDGSLQDAQTKGDPPPSGSMIMEAKGVDLSKLSESQRATFFQVINTEPSACDKPHSMAKSLRDDARCRDSLIAAQFIADRLTQGSTPSQVKEQLEFVLDALKPREIDIAGSPVYGNDEAPVTLVVFADFQCPHCKAEVPVLRKAVDQFRGRAKLVFKHFPLSSHSQARQAAIATVAAQEQGKFWEMHDIVFAHQNELSEEEIRSYAKEIGLDMNAFERSFTSDASEARVEQDRKLGEKLEIGGTPAVFVDGRVYNELLFGGTVTGWIDDALKR